MSSKYCPAGKIECGHWELESEVPFLGLFHCREIGDALLGCDIFQLKQCPWPSRQKPVVASTDDIKLEMDIKMELAYSAGFRKGQEEIVDMVRKTLIANGNPAVGVAIMKAINSLEVKGE